MQRDGWRLLFVNEPQMERYYLWDEWDLYGRWKWKSRMCMPDYEWMSLISAADFGCVLIIRCCVQLGTRYGDGSAKVFEPNCRSSWRCASSHASKWSASVASVSRATPGAISASARKCSDWQPFKRRHKRRLRTKMKQITAQSSIAFVFFSLSFCSAFNPFCCAWLNRLKNHLDLLAW